MELSGHSSHAGKQVRFRRDKTGKLDPNGKLSPRRYELHCKYQDSSRFAFGVAAVELPDGTIAGRRCNIITYSGRWVCTIKVYMEKRQAEIERVRNLKDGGTDWVEVNRGQNTS